MILSSPLTKGQYPATTPSGSQRFLGTEDRICLPELLGSHPENHWRYGQMPGKTQHWYWDIYTGVLEVNILISWISTTMASSYSDDLWFVLVYNPLHVYTYAYCNPSSWLLVLKFFLAAWVARAETTMKRSCSIWIQRWGSPIFYVWWI